MPGVIPAATVGPGDISGLSSDPVALLKRRDRGLRARSYPPAGKPVASTALDNWLRLAPLASPETLSESSSLVSCAGSGGAGVAGQRIMSAVVILPLRMDPILQSPARSTSNSQHDDCCTSLYIQSAADVDLTSTLRKSTTPFAHDVDKPNVMTACVEKVPSACVACVDNSRPPCAACSQDDPDVVPAKPSHASAGCSSTVPTSSLDVIQQTTCTEQWHTHHAMPTDDHGNHTLSDTPPHSCEGHGACVCDSLRPDVIVSTRDFLAAAELNAPSTDE